MVDADGRDVGRPASRPRRRPPAARRPGPDRPCRPRRRGRRCPGWPRPASAGSAAGACRTWSRLASSRPRRRIRRAGRSGCRPHERAGRRARAGRVVDGHAGFVAGGFDAEDAHGGVGDRGMCGPAEVAWRKASVSYYAAPPGLDGIIPNRETVCRASKSAKTSLSDLPCAASSAPAREAGVLAETRKREFYEKPHAGTQAQGRRRGEAPGPSHLARRHQAPAPVLIPRRRRSARTATPSHPRSRLRTPRAGTRISAFARPRSRHEPQDQLTDDMKSAMKAGRKERLGVIRLVNAAIKQRKSTSASNSTTRRSSPSSTRWSSSAAIRCRSTTPPAARTGHRAQRDRDDRALPAGEDVRGGDRRRDRRRRSATAARPVRPTWAS